MERLLFWKLYLKESLRKFEGDEQGLPWDEDKTGERGETGGEFWLFCDDCLDCSSWTVDSVPDDDDDQIFLLFPTGVDWRGGGCSGRSAKGGFCIREITCGTMFHGTNMQTYAGEEAKFGWARNDTAEDEDPTSCGEKEGTELGDENVKDAPSIDEAWLVNAESGAWCVQDSFRGWGFRSLLSSILITVNCFGISIPIAPVLIISWTSEGRVSVLQRKRKVTKEESWRSISNLW